MINFCEHLHALHRGCYDDERETKTFLRGIISLQNDKGDGAGAEILAPRYSEAHAKVIRQESTALELCALRYCVDKIWHFSTQESKQHKGLKQHCGSLFNKMLIF
jgi:hypothetical protein